MNKKGFSLVELIAVISIIAVLAIMIIPALIEIRKSVINDTLQNRISMIENAAKDYAQDNIDELNSHVTAVYNGEKTPNENCIYRNVNFLVSHGYITISNTYTPNDNLNSQTKTNQIIDPTTGLSMGTRRVCIRFDNNNAMSRRIVAYLVEE